MLPEIDINRIVVMVVPLLFAVSAHEAAHGFAALKMGDDTAARAGRVTINPIRHLDPIGSFLLPLMLGVFGAPFVFGYARPVPVNFARLKNWKKGTLWVSAAGVMANLALLIISGIFFRITLFAAQALMPMGPTAMFLMTDLLLICAYSVIINGLLAIFNLIPIPPLDGSKILLVFLPPHMRKRFASLDRFGIILVLILLMVKADWLFTFIWYLITPLIYIALGSTGLAFITGG
jgi:Zn-dependent protease